MIRPKPPWLQALFPWEHQALRVNSRTMAYIEHGAGDPILMRHGEPTWGYLYRHMIAPLADVGRIIVPDLIGFGRSDKPVADTASSCKAHVRWLRRFIETLDLQRITLVGQDPRTPALGGWRPDYRCVGRACA